MASDLERSLLAAHLSIVAIISEVSLTGIVSPNFRPRGLPLVFLCTLFSCLPMILCVHENG
jgi:hypothetical protein